MERRRSPARRTPTRSRHGMSCGRRGCAQVWTRALPWAVAVLLGAAPAAASPRPRAALPPPQPPAAAAAPAPAAATSPAPAAAASPAAVTAPAAPTPAQAAAAASVAAAGSLPGSITSLTLQQAIELALRGNPGLRAQAATVDSTRAGEITAALRPNPTLSNGTVDFTGGIGWTFERGGKRQRRIDSARLATAGAERDLLDATRTLTGAVRASFTAALLARGNLRAARDNLANFQQVEDLNRIRHEKGEISGGDFLKIGLQKLQFQTDVQDADLAYRTARANLRQQLYAPELAQDFEVAGELRPAPLGPTLAEIEALALMTRPDLLSAQTAMRKAEADVRLAEANAKVDVTASLGWVHTGPSLVSDDHVSPFFSIGQTANALGSGISFPLPIFNRNQGEIARTRSEVVRTRWAADTVRAQVIADVETAYAALRASQERVDLYERVYLQQSHDSREIAEFAYRRGATSILDLLDAERTDRATQLAYRQALADQQTRRAQLEAAVGVPLQ
jgi:cobalt-zinc-cadmium efflux system outer membrane protein